LLHEGVECAQLIIDGYQNYLRQCVATYLSSITHDYSSGCRYVKNLMNCWSAPFGGSGQIPSPGCRRAGAADVWWACEANRVFTLNQFPNCGYSCDGQFIWHNPLKYCGYGRIKCVTKTSPRYVCSSKECSTGLCL
ncbi:hypothetical protein TELCIR_13806, partial [Teladorsagia circumcincta]